MNEVVLLFEPGILEENSGLQKFITENKNYCFIADVRNSNDIFETISKVVLICRDSSLIPLAKKSNISIGYKTFDSVLLDSLDYAVYDEKRLIDLLGRILFNFTKKDVSIVISCAGMGTRLGLNCTKALIEIAGKSLIERQLDILKNYNDIRIVVGYQAEKVIEKVNKIRSDVLYVFNHAYRTTGTGASFTAGARYAGEYACALDGDLLVYPEDLIKVMEFDGSCVGGTTPSSDEPWTMPTKMIDGVQQVMGFSKSEGIYEWTGLAKVKASLLKPGTHHVFHLIEPLLPLPMIFIHTKEIDTMDDYARAVKWIENGYED